ncbi:hypothetical protein EYF80_023185 [Liparis tanakae]|uniref:Uncharacterized protein n=1 Tax=Liparis tanakae TaxID=230148 RepID=A0A4Z2HM91_9TELE|nr:hypothetical protein EYF80_023185 [Liparis tanakae]
MQPIKLLLLEAAPDGEGGSNYSQVQHPIKWIVDPARPSSSNMRARNQTKIMLGLHRDLGNTLLPPQHVPPAHDCERLATLRFIASDLATLAASAEGSLLGLYLSHRPEDS